jgi:hypothetical protein
MTQTLFETKDSLDKLDKLSIIVKGKLSYTAWRTVIEKPSEGKRGRGRPRATVRKEKVKLADLVIAKIAEFQTAKITLYGKEQEIQYYCENLNWGETIEKVLRFVIVIGIGKDPTILACTNLNLDPIKIIWLYSLRFNIENTFKSLKQTVYAFSSHFWSLAFPELNYYQKSTDPNPLASITDPIKRLRVVAAVKATEGYMHFCMMALGILQMVAINYANTKEFFLIRYLRTHRKGGPSVESIADIVRKNVFMFLHTKSKLQISQIILHKQHRLTDDEDHNAA